eukprot:COSAG02_NODE_873_length_16302_cov_113.473616_16_plen_196_part_00
MRTYSSGSISRSRRRIGVSCHHPMRSPSSSSVSDGREKQIGLDGAEKRRLTTWLAWPRAHLPAASRRTRRCRCATRATPAAQVAPPTPAPRHSADTGTTRPRPKPRPLPQPGRTPCPADPSPPLYRLRPAPAPARGAPPAKRPQPPQKGPLFLRARDEPGRESGAEGNSYNTLKFIEDIVASAWGREAPSPLYVP